ncbi:MAG: isoleucine--tRNA ligase [Candidatus Saccharimonadales bacterium]
MKFKANTRRRAIDYEKDILDQWKKNKTFEKSIAQRPASNNYVFYDGPPFITGLPHHGTLLISTIKDTVARYQTMKGKRVERTWGWDCHGLPAEVYVEKKLNIKDKSEIGTKISIHDYVRECRTAMVQGGNEWEEVIDRLGRWVEFKGAYKTMDKDYMESIWWAFTTLYKKGKIYEGEKVLMYCVHDGTPISKSEVAMENSYKEVTDPSLFTYFKLVDEDMYLLAWTTTPWTLPANVALAVNPSLMYNVIEYGGKKIVVAKGLEKEIFADEKHQPLTYKIVGEVSGKELVGKKYEPLFENHGPNAHKVMAADFVSSEDGTGIVHIAPAYGEDDFSLAQANSLPVVHVVDENGNYASGRWLGQNIWEVNKEIAKTLLTEGVALKIDYIRHEYPHCHRCGNKLIYKAHSSWFMDIQDQKEEMQKANDSTNWVPKALKEKRFHNVIDSAPDWNLSRDRFWATPIPVWKGRKGDGTEVVKAFDSYEEFEQFTGKKLGDYHLPMVMDITFELDGATMTHIGKVIDCWFESGSMPFAQFHYPFENEQKFKNNFPADFITEGVDQTRGWFYSLTAVNVALFGQSPYKNLICTGFINAADGKKVSKKLKNYTDPTELMDSASADAMRLFFLSSPLVSGEDANLADKDVKDVGRKLSMIWNMYDFFTMYAEVDGWEFGGKLTEPKDLDNPLDQWIVSRVHQLLDEVGKNIDSYDLQSATRPILPFIDDASNWYVRRSRRRFWKSGDDGDKNDAYKTLHYVLTMLAQIIAPFTPFLAEELYQKLTGGESVHLLDWPMVGDINGKLVDDMSKLRGYVNEGLSIRAKNQLKVRQPLASVTIPEAGSVFNFEDILKEELNVKSVKVGGDFDVSLDITPELKREGLMREVVRNIQNLRKQSGLHVDDRISLNLYTEDSELEQAIDEHVDEIKRETLAVDFSKTDITTAQNEKITIDDKLLTIGLEKR